MILIPSMAHDVKLHLTALLQEEGMSSVKGKSV